MELLTKWAKIYRVVLIISIVIVILGAIGYIIKDVDVKKCPKCAEIVKKEARIYRFCGYEFYSKPDT